VSWRTYSPQGPGQVGFKVSFFGKENVATFHADQGKIELVADAREQLPIVREGTLRASFGQRHLVNARAFLINNVPFLNPKAMCEQQNFLGIRRELCFVGFAASNPEKKSKRVVGEYEYARVVLSQRIFAVSAEFQIPDVRSQGRLQRLF
jgi:hypothetical protein